MIIYYSIHYLIYNMMTTRTMMLQTPNLSSFRAIPSNITKTNIGKNRRKYTSYPSMDTSSFITTVINRMAMPESPTQTNKNTEFKITFDQFYRVMLHYSNWPEDTNKTIAKRVKMAVPILTMKNCEAIVKQTFKYGLCIICTVPQDKAVLYKDALTQFGLNATIEEA